MELRYEDHARLVAVEWLPAVGPFGAFGRSWSVQTDDPDLAALVADLYDDMSVEVARKGAHATFRVAVKDGSLRSLVARDDLHLGGGGTESSTMGVLVWGINRWVLDEASRDHLLLHAGGVVREDGLAVVLPAPSESGKSTLTAGLLELGFGYLSDEAVALLPDGTVRGFAKPISIDRGAWDVLATHRPDPGAPGADYLDNQWHIRASRMSTTVRSGRLGAVIFPRYERLGQQSIAEVGPGEKVVLAGASTFAPGNTVRIELGQVEQLGSALTGVPAYRLVTDDLAWSCRSIMEIVDRLA